MTIDTTGPAQFQPDPEHCRRVSSIQEFQFGSYAPDRVTYEPGVRLRFDKKSGGYNQASSQTLTLPQLAGLVEIAAQHFEPELRTYLIAVLEGKQAGIPHLIVQADADRWEPD